MRAASLRKQLKRSLLSVTGARSVSVHTTMVEPKVTSKELAEKYPAVVIVHRGAFKLSLYKNLKLAKTYGIAVGRVGLETPAGLYHIQNKAVNPAWHVPNSRLGGAGLAGKVIPGGSPENPIKARWMGIFDGAGIHGTDDAGSIGSRRLARLHPHARSRTSSELYDAGAGRRAGLHRLGASQAACCLRVVAAISSTATSCQPFCSREAWWSGWRMHSVPMYTPRTCLRITAYHRVVASLVPWIRCQGGARLRR